MLCFLPVVDMDKNKEVIELLDIYREMDTDGRKKMVTAASKLLKTQKVMGNMLNNTKSKSNDIIRYLVTVAMLLITACLFWVFLISPALIINSDTPLIITRIVITACFGMVFISTGIFLCILRKLTLFLMFFAIVAGIGCVDPHVLTDIIGFAIITMVTVLQFKQIKRTKTSIAIIF
jgi:hypothetical protein